jgi:hypothetical protein
MVKSARRGRHLVRSKNGVDDKGKRIHYTENEGLPSSRDGGTGRRSGLKIRRYLVPWGFNSPSRHHFSDSKTLKLCLTSSSLFEEFYGGGSLVMCGRGVSEFMVAHAEGVVGEARGSKLNAPPMVSER